ncbi:MAG: hypothetical protein ABSC92_03910 [Rhizomicrobium sp.]|jgi:hypothetical protein
MVQPSGDDDDDRSATNMVVLVVVAVIVVVGCFVAWEMKKETTLEDCYASGQRNCAPIDTQGPH